MGFGGGERSISVSYLDNLFDLDAEGLLDVFEN